METRKITVVSTKDQKKYVIMSSASTLGELKTDLRQNNIDYKDMAFYEGLSKTELINDSSILPHDITYKGTVTNELVFMLTNINKKIKSGAMSRSEAYNKIKKLGLQEECIRKFGKNYTVCKTADLIALVQNNTVTNDKTEKDKNLGTSANTFKELSTVARMSNNNKYVDTVAKAAIYKLVEILENAEILNDCDKKQVTDILEDKKLEVSEKDNSKLHSSYSDEEIDNMLAELNIE